MVDASFFGLYLLLVNIEWKNDGFPFAGKLTMESDVGVCLVANVVLLGFFSVGILVDVLGEDVHPTTIAVLIAISIVFEDQFTLVGIDVGERRGISTSCSIVALDIYLFKIRAVGEGLCADSLSTSRQDEFFQCVVVGTEALWNLIPLDTSDTR